MTNGVGDSVGCFGMPLIFGAGLLVVVGIAGLIEANHYRPLPPGYFLSRVGAPSRLSETAFDLLRIGGWALIIFGGLLAMVGLIRFYAAHIRT
jgi:hypothetical protein